MQTSCEMVCYLSALADMGGNLLLSLILGEKLHSQHSRVILLLRQIFSWHNSTDINGVAPGGWEFGLLPFIFECVFNIRLCQVSALGVFDVIKRGKHV